MVHPNRKGRSAPLFPSYNFWLIGFQTVATWSSTLLHTIVPSLFRVFPALQKCDVTSMNYHYSDYASVHPGSTAAVSGDAPPEQG